ncbi:MAG: glucose-1-phosphate thymidylyltransferase [Candidatus Magasanikbacteria bacterium CG1_02_32_51]|uniref:Glucose-1-phosphate thymidylyltransferase n=1 Tax=Candidatus Magasanikbacteria bacterium CG1_02_32_51 TaxID=1805238 RepID=A0A1J4U680_9BACT|nr:MAG: glucose-1-phosphate thymidylyltransferase [Candidatus Magasanikbacteria bacterium CG1_02_32_51]
MKIRKAILTGGGRATRLHPITTTINKHLLPLANKPMIFYAIEKAVEAGIEEIFINTNPGEKDLENFIGDGGHWGIKIKFFEQTGGPQGIAHVVNEAKDFIGDEPFMFYLSDNIIFGSLKPLFEEFEKNNYDCMLALSEVSDPQRFGVPIFDGNKKLIDVLEKPANPQNNFAVTGIYLYGPKLFFEAFQNIKKSDRGEYEISSIHSNFLKNNKNVGYKEITGWWKDTGKIEDLLIASRLLLEEMPETNFSNYGTIEDGVQIKGKVHIGLGSKIAKDVVLIGPIIIGENCILSNCKIGPNTTIGSGCEIKNATIKDSIILDNTYIDVDLSIANSLIGKNVKIIKKTTTDGRSMLIGDKTIVEI